MSIKHLTKAGIVIADQANFSAASVEGIYGKKFISFVDDDTARTEDITRYHTMCDRNGIKGNFAIITNYLNGNSPLTDPATLLQYESEGYGCLFHAWRQNSSDHNYFVPENRDLASCYSNIVRGLRDMATHGFINYKYWISPNGVYDKDMQDLARFCGLKALFSFAPADGEYEYNHINYSPRIDRYHIHRTAFSNIDSNRAGIDAVKGYIDNLMDSDGGWLIITTHFNEWRELTWNTAEDDKGVIGYERFNTIAEYSVASGAEIVTIPQGFSLIEPTLAN